MILAYFLCQEVLLYQYYFDYAHRYFERHYAYLLDAMPCYFAAQFSRFCQGRLFIARHILFHRPFSAL